MYYIVGLGNPGENHAAQRHNAGRMALDYLEAKISDKTQKKIKIITPDTYMNLSGKFVMKFIKSKKAAENLIVVYDDIDLPLGTIKISWNKSSGGHNGLESVIKAVKTKEFTRIRIGISPKKKPVGEEAVLKFLLSDFRKPELEILKKIFKKITETVEVIVLEGRDKAMNLYN